MQLLKKIFTNGLIALGLSLGSTVAAIAAAGTVDAATNAPFVKDFMDNKKLAEQSNLDARSRFDAQVYIANKYEYGIGVSQSNTKTKEWTEKALVTGKLLEEKGNADADVQIIIGDIYGSIFFEDKVKAKVWYRKGLNTLEALANKDNIDAHSRREAQSRLGYIYKRGLGWYEEEEIIPSDEAKAEEWFVKAFATAKELAEKGDADDKYLLGLMYGSGEGVRQNKVTAEEWFVKAANQGSGSAAYGLGSKYLNRERDYVDDNGVQIPSDKAKAKEWFKKGCDLGDRFSCHELDD